MIQAAPQSAAQSAAQTPPPSAPDADKMPRLERMYRESIVPALMEKHGYRSPLQAPRVLKIVLNMGVGEAVADRKMIDNSMRDLTQIAAQKPIPTLARKSIAAFKLRQGVALGCKVTLRRRRMFDFLDRLVSIALPRTRDFQGLPLRGFDGRGNYSLGVAEQIVFYEIKYEQVDVLRGLDVAIVTNAKNDEAAAELLRMFRFPLRDN